MIATSCDPVVRETAKAGLVLDLPEAVWVDYDLFGAGWVRRRVGDWSGTVYDDLLPLDHDCVSCTVREDLVATVDQLTTARRWSSVVLFPPTSTAPTPLAHQLHHGLRDGALPAARLACVVAFIDLRALPDDLFGDDLLDERGLALGRLDRRAVGEALAAQLEFADVVVAIGDRDPTGASVLRRVVSPSTRIELDWAELDGASLLECEHDHDLACDRVDPLRLWPVHTDGQPEVWTVQLESSRPLHPNRLRGAIAQLGSGRIRARGHFWLASRPDVACAWDASGGQLSIGTIGGWAGLQPGTRLVVTGDDPGDRTRIERAFADLSVRRAEEIDAVGWVGRPDGFEPWLG